MWGKFFGARDFECHFPNQNRGKVFCKNFAKVSNNYRIVLKFIKILCCLRIRIFLLKSSLVYFVHCFFCFFTNFTGKVLLCFVQEEREKEENRLAEIMEENNRKILDAQRKLVRGV